MYILLRVLLASAQDCAVLVPESTLPVLGQNLVLGVLPRLRLPNSTLIANSPSVRPIQAINYYKNQTGPGLPLRDLDFLEVVQPDLWTSAGIAQNQSSLTLYLANNKPFEPWQPTKTLALDLDSLSLKGALCLEVTMVKADSVLISCYLADSLYIIAVDSKIQLVQGPFPLEIQPESSRSKLYSNKGSTFLATIAQQGVLFQLTLLTLQTTTLQVQRLDYSSKSFVDLDVDGDWLYLLDQSKVTVVRLSLDKAHELFVVKFELKGVNKLRAVPGKGVLIANANRAVVLNFNSRELATVQLTQAADLQDLQFSPKILLAKTKNTVQFYSFEHDIMVAEVYAPSAQVMLTRIYDQALIVQADISRTIVVMEPAVVLQSTPAGQVQISASSGQRSCKIVVNVIKQKQAEAVYLNPAEPIRLSEQQTLIPVEHFVSGPNVTLNVSGPDVVVGASRTASAVKIEGSLPANLVGMQLRAYNEGAFLRVSYNSSLLRVERCFEQVMRCVMASEVPTDSAVALLSVENTGSALAFTTLDKPGLLFLIQVKSGIVLSRQFQQVTDVVLSKTKLVVLIKKLTTVQIMGYDFGEGGSIWPGYAVDGSSFPAEFFFLPQQVKLWPRDENVIAVKLLDQVVLMILGSQAAQVVGQFQVEGVESLAVQWDYFLSAQRLALLVNGNLTVVQLTTSIVQKSIDLTVLALASPLVLSHPFGSDSLFVLLKDKSYFNVRFDRPLHSALSHSYPVSATPSRLTSILMEQSVLLGWPTDKQPSFVTDYLVQGAVARFAGRLTNFVNQVQLVLGVTNNASKFDQKASGLVVNYQLKLTASEVLPNTRTDRNATVQLNDSAWFNGSRIKYTLACTECPRNIDLVQHVTPFVIVGAVEPLLLYHPPSLPVVWAVQAESIVQVSRDGLVQRVLLLIEEGMTCSAIFYSNIEEVAAFGCSSEQSSRVYVLSVNTPTPAVLAEVELPYVTQILGLQFEQGFVFALCSLPSTLVIVNIYDNLVTQLTASTWAVDSKMVGFRIVAQKNKPEATLLVLLDNFGVGVARVTLDKDLVVGEQKGYQLVGTVPAFLKGFMVAGNKLVQMEVTDLAFSPTQIDVIFLVTCSASSHLKLRMSLPATGTLEANLSLVQAFNRYGQQTVLPLISKGCGINCGCAQNNFALAYVSGSRVTYAVYQYGGHLLQEILGGYQHSRGDAVTMTLFADKLAYAGEAGLIICNVSNNLTLVVRSIDQSVRTQLVNISAESEYGKAQFQVQLRFAEEGRGWLFWLVMAGLAVAVVLLIGGTVLYKYRKARQENTQTLVQTDSL